MNIDPLSTALKEITETQSLLEGLIQSSERFDYPKAKTALRRLNRKVHLLGKVRAEFEARLKARTPNIHILDFRGRSRPAASDTGRV